MPAEKPRVPPSAHRPFDGGGEVTVNAPRIKRRGGPFPVEAGLRSYLQGAFYGPGGVDVSNIKAKENENRTKYLKKAHQDSDIVYCVRFKSQGFFAPASIRGLPPGTAFKGPRAAAKGYLIHLGFWFMTMWAYGVPSHIM